MPLSGISPHPTYTVSLNRFTPKPESDGQIDIQAAVEDRRPLSPEAIHKTIVQATTDLPGVAISNQANLFALDRFPAKADAKVLFHKDDWLLAGHFADERPEELRTIPINTFCDTTDVQTQNVFTVQAQRKQILNILTTIGLAAKKHLQISGTSNEWIALAVRDYPFWEQHLNHRLELPATAISAKNVAPSGTIEPYPDSTPFVIPAHDDKESDLSDVPHTGNEPLQQQQIYNHKDRIAILIDHVLAKDDRLFAVA